MQSLQILSNKKVYKCVFIDIIFCIFLGGEVSIAKKTANFISFKAEAESQNVHKIKGWWDAKLSSPHDIYRSPAVRTSRLYTHAPVLWYV